MTSPFRLLNETPTMSESGNTAVPEPWPTPPTTAVAPMPLSSEPIYGGPVEGAGGMFEGAGGIDMTGPPDIGSELRRIPWQKGQTVPHAPPATLDRFCCLTGPCRWYSEVHVDDPSCLPEARVNVIRLCRRFLDDEGGTLEMSEATINACQDYSPPWWSLSGWRMKLVVARRLDYALSEISKVVASPVWAKLETWGVIPKEKSGYGSRTP